MESSKLRLSEKTHLAIKIIIMKTYWDIQNLFRVTKLALSKIRNCMDIEKNEKKFGKTEGM